LAWWSDQPRAGHAWLHSAGRFQFAGTSGQRVDDSVQLRRQRRTHADQPASIRILEADAVRMQEQAAQAEAVQLPVEIRIAIFLIPGNGMS